VKALIADEESQNEFADSDVSSGEEEEEQQLEEEQQQQEEGKL